MQSNGNQQQTRPARALLGFVGSSPHQSFARILLSLKHTPLFWHCKIWILPRWKVTSFEHLTDTLGWIIPSMYYWSHFIKIIYLHFNLPLENEPLREGLSFASLSPAHSGQGRLTSCLPSSRWINVNGLLVLTFGLLNNPVICLFTYNKVSSCEVYKEQLLWHMYIGRL